MRPLAVTVFAWVLLVFCVGALVVGVVAWLDEPDSDSTELLCLQAERAGVNLPECP